MIWAEGHGSPERLTSGDTLWHGYVSNITERKQSENQIRKLALYDPLTGVANRRLFKEKLQHAIATSQRNQKHGAVIMLDLDNFKILNDTRGHDVGDSMFVDEGFVKSVKDIISASGIDPCRLKLELTESYIFQDLNRGQAILAEFNKMGISIELDDFGTGYSSLNTLNKLPFSTIKLDKSLINDIEVEEAHGPAILRAAIAMAKAMSMKIIGEGVETPGQKDFLFHEGCDLLQGYLFARPMPIDDFIQYLLLSNLQLLPEIKNELLM